jgi:hypothetical protein
MNPKPIVRVKGQLTRFPDLEAKLYSRHFIEAHGIGQSLASLIKLGWSHSVLAPADR